MKKEIPITEHEKLARAVDELKKDIFETWLGKFMFWILDRLSQMINWGRKIWQKKIKVIREDEVEKEVKAGTVCLYYSRKLGGAFVPEIARKKILKGAEFCFWTDEPNEKI